MSAFPLFKIILSFVGVVTFIVLTAVTYSYKLGLALKLVLSPATNFILSKDGGRDLTLSRSVQRFSISACNKVWLILCLLLVSTLSTVQAQGYIDCATIITDDDFGSFNVTEAKVVNGYTYLMVSASYGGPSFDRFPVINGEPSIATGFSAETYFAIFDPACNQIKGTYVSAEEGDLIATDLETDAAGNAYVLSFASLTNGVATTDGTTINGEDNFVLHKYDPAGNLIYSTVYGGSDGFNDNAGKVATDGNDVYVYGAIRSATDFPTTDGTTISGSDEQYLVKYDMNGNLVYATLLGGSSFDGPADIKIVNGCAIAVGSTGSSDFPTTDGTSFQGINDITLTKYDPMGNIVFSTIFGGTASENYFPGTQLAVDGSCIVIAGATSSPDFPTTDGTTSSGAQDAYVRKYDLQGNLIFSTIIGSSGNDQSTDVVLEGGEIYVMGQYANSDFPVTVGATNNNGVFVLKLDAAGNTIYSTSYGSTIAFTSYGIFVDTDGSVILPVTTAQSIATDNQALGSEGLYVAKLNPDGTLCSSNYVTASEQRRNYNTCPSIQGDTLYLVGSVFGASPAGISTDGTEWSDNDNEDFSITKFVLCASPDPILVDTLSNDTIVVCENGIIDKIEGMDHVIDGGQFPAIYIDGTLSNQADLPLVYQWQLSSTGSDPWTDIQGPLSQQQNYTPSPTTIDAFYRRQTKISECCGGTIVSTSEVVMIDVSDEGAPMVEMAETYYTCPGSPVMIDVSVVGGTPPYTYDWDDGLFNVEDPVVSPMFSTVYTLEVTDVNGCMQAGQATVVTYDADAGPNADVCAGDGVTIGGMALMGVPSVPSGGTPPMGEFSIGYDWSPTTGLSCSDCPNPVAAPTAAQNYMLTTTIYYPDGTSCQTDDMVSMDVIDAPTNGEFAGLDRVICLGDTQLLGTAPEGFVGPFFAQANGSTTTSGTLNVAELSDGNTSTGVKTNDGTSQEVILNLGSVNTLNRIDIAIINNQAFDSDFTIEGSADGINYTTLLANVRTTSAALNTVSSVATTTLTFSEQDIQFFRFTPESNFRDVGIGEFSASFQTFSYIWTPGSFITTDGSFATFDAGNIDMPSVNPITYNVTANSGTCNFFDQVTVAVIEARAGLDACGPRLLGETDRTPDIEEVYTWAKIADPSITTGSGDLVGDTDILNAPVSATSGGQVGYELTVSYTLPSGATGTCKDTVIVPEICPGAACSIFVVDGGCPDFEDGSVVLRAIPQDLNDPNNWTFSWDSDQGMNGLDNYTNQEVTLIDNVTRTYTVTMTNVIDPSFSCTSSLEVNSPAFSTPVINVDPEATVCKGDSVNIGDPSFNSGLSYSWNNAQFLDEPNTNFPLASPPITTDFVLTATDLMTGCLVMDTVTVIVPTAANAGPDFNVCNNGVVTLGANTVAAGLTYSWEPAGAAWEPGFGPTDAMPEVFVATSQQFTLTASDATGTCVTRDTVMVIVEPLPPPFSLSDIDFCPSDAAPTLGTADGTPGGTNEVPAGFLYTWSPGTVSDASAQNPTVGLPLPTVPTSYTVVISTAGGCNQVATQTINPVIEPPSTSSPSTICLGEMLQLGSDDNDPGLDYVWTSNDTDVSSTLDNTMSPNPTFTPDAPGTFMFTVTNTNSQFNCSSTAEVTVTVIELLAPALAPFTICEGASVQIGVANDPSVQYQWMPETGLDDPFISNPTFSGTSSQNYTLTVVNQNGCTAESVSSVTVNPAPAVTVMQDDLVFCSADMTSIIFDPTVSPAGNYAYKWTPSDNLDNASALTPEFFVPGEGMYQYVLELIDQATGCSIFDTLNIEINNFNPAPAITASSSTACTGESVTFNSTVNEALVNYQWQVSTVDCSAGFTDIVGATMDTYTVIPSQESFYRVIVTTISDECPNESNCLGVSISEDPICSVSGDTLVLPNAQDEPYMGPAGMLSYQWTIVSGDAAIDGPDDTQNIIVDLGSLSSEISLTTTNTDGCETTCSLITEPGFLDLALTKEINTTATPGPYAPGSTVQFTITIVNQGTLDAFDVDVADYNPIGLGDATLVVGQTGVVENAPNDFTLDFVAAGMTATFEVEAVIDADFMGTSLVNDAEITGGSDSEGGPDATDVDSTPGDNADPNDPNDNDTAATDGSDDQDPAEVPVDQTFDLALTKAINTTATPGPYVPGGDVTYTIEVINQGTLDAFAVAVVDYIPVGLTLNDAAWTDNAGIAELNTAIASIPAGTSTTVDITFTIDADFMGSSIVNVAEISAADDDMDDTNTPPTDVDSTPDTTDGNDAGGEPGSDTDDSTDGDGSGAPGDTDPATDEDDSDPALVDITQTFDLALTKVVNTTATPGPYMQGSTVTYTLNVINQGTLDAFNVELVDYIPEGLTLADANWTDNGGIAELNTPIASVPAGTTQTVDISFTIDADFQGSSIENTAEISAADDDMDPTNTPPTDVDSEPDSNPNDDDFGGDDVTDNTNGDEDDSDPAVIPVGQSFDLALTKTLSEVTPGPFAPGSTVTFDINVFNQGSVDAFNVSVVDYIPTGLTLADADWSENTPGVAEINNSIAALGQGEDITVTITFTIDTDFMETSIVNVAEISSADDDTDPTNTPPVDVDSTPDDTEGNDAGGEPGTDSDDSTGGDGSGAPGDTDATTDEDDSDPVLIDIEQIFDLALTKAINTTATPGPYAPGDDVTYTIEVINQGTLDAFAVAVVDYIPVGLTLNDAAWTDNAGIAELNTPIATIAAGESATVDITFTIDADFMGSSIVNVAEISAADDDMDPTNTPPTDVDSTPDATEGDDAGGEPGSDTDGSVDGDGSGAPGDTDPATDEDDSDPAIVDITQTFDLALTKVVNTTATPGPYMQGSTVTYTLNVINQGTLDAFNVELVDYIPEGLTLADAAWTDNAGIAELNTPIASVPAGTTQTIDISFTIDADFMGSSIENTAEISAADDDMDPTNTPPTDVDSEPDSNPEDDDFGGDNVTDNTNGDEDDSDPEVIPVGQSFDLALTKTLSEVTPGPFAPGSTVTFDINVFNQGSVDAFNVSVVDYTPEGLTLADPNWSSVGVNTVEINNPIGFIPMGGMTTVTITFTIDADFMGTSITNFAEISSADDDTNPNNTPPTDFDSEPDTDPTDDTVGGDDVTDGTGGDEDDHDPEVIDVNQTFDLALTKIPLNEGPFAYGDVVAYEIEVFNQGTIDAYNVSVVDVLPCGLNYVMENDPLWSYDGLAMTATTIIAGPIAPGDSETLLIYSAVVACSDADAYVNIAEISGAENAAGDPQDDVDGTFDSDPNNDPGGESGGDSDNTVDGDGSGTPGGGDETDDEDNQDPAEVMVFDLALAKTTNATGPFNAGDVITFDITVTNQGNVDAYDVDIVDVIPCGFEYDLGNNAVWTFDPGANVATTTIEGPIAASGGTSVVTISLIVNPCAGTDSYTNIAEISGADDIDGEEMPDADGTFDDNPNNDPGGNPDTDSDDVIDGDGTGTPGDDVAGTDEDNQDPELIEIVDLAIDKQLASTGPFSLGGTVTFNVVVSNQGNVDAYNVGVIDYLPEGLAYLAVNDPTWSYDGTNATTTIPFIAAGASVTVPITLEIAMASGGADVFTNVVEITGSEDPNGDPQDDVDSDPDVDPMNDPEGEDDIDPEGIDLFDLALNKTTAQEGPFSYGDQVTFTITVFNQGSIAANDIDVIDHIPCGFNYLPVNEGIWTFNSITGNASTTIETLLNPGESISVDIILEVVRCTGDLEAYTNIAEISGADNFETGLPGDDNDSTPDFDPTNDGDPIDNEVNDPNDEDDHDPELIEIYDVALAKTLETAGPYAYGDLLTFDIEVTNQGNTTVYDVEVSDYIPAGYSFSALLNGDWTEVDGIATTTIPQIDPLTSETVSITLELVMTSGGALDWYNEAEVSGMNDDEGNPVTDIDSELDNDPDNDNDVELDGDDDNEIDGDSTAGEDEDDNDPAGIDVFDLALTKVATTAGPYAYGQLVDFTIEVFNQGSIVADNIEVTDYIPCGYIYAPSNDGTWTYDAVTGNATTVLAGTLDPGASTTVSITLQIQPCADAADAWTNVAEISSATDDEGTPQEDIDGAFDDDETNDPGGNPDSPSDDVVDGDGTGNPGDEDPDTDEDNADPVFIEVFDLALFKTLDTPETYAYGDVLDFSITVINQGNVDAFNVEVTDYLPAGFDFDAGANTIWTLDANGYLVANIETIPVGGQVVLPLSLTLTGNGASSEDYINIAEISDADNDMDPDNDGPTDADSNPDNNPDNDNDVEPGDDNDDVVDEDPNDPFGDGDDDEDDSDPAGPIFFDLALNKTTAQEGPFSYGDEVVFSLNVFNQGTIVATNVEVTETIPCGYMYAPSNDATWMYDAATGVATTTITELIEPGENTSVDITLVVQPCSEDGAWVNIGEISDATDDEGNPQDDIDSTPDTDPNNDGDPTDDDVNGSGNCDDCIQTVVVPLAGATPPIVSEVFVDGEVLALPNYPYDLRDPAQAALFLADCIALGYDVVESFDPATQLLTIDVRYPGQTFDSFNLNGGEEFFFTCSECTSGGPDEDDNDPEEIEVFDLALFKTLVTPEPYAYGDALDFTITVINQGNVDGVNVEVTDYLAAGYDFDPAVNPDWALDAEGNLVTTVASLPAGEQVELPITLTLTSNGNGTADYTNVAEISGADDDDDPTNEDPTDADSNPDNNPDNDNDVEPGDDNDDVVDEDPNDPFDEGDDDEDDSDPAGPTFYDLALTKTTMQTGPFSYGESVTFTMTVFNQGFSDANNVVVSEYIPCGYIYDASNDGTWTYDPVTGIATTTITDLLEAGTSTTVDITVVIQPCDEADAWTNIAEITSFTDEDGNPEEDIDSTPDGDPTNDGDPVDNEVNDPTDEDDHDPETIDIFDLALFKTVVTELPYTYGDNIEFAITVINQGNVDGVNVEITDYLAAGYNFDPAINAGWTLNGDGNLEYTIGSLPVGSEVVLPIFLELTSNGNGAADYTNQAEISGADDDDDPTNEDPTDADSTPDGDPDNDNEVEPGDDNDDVVDEDPNDPFGEGDDDEDDSDPALPLLFDLALTKTTAQAGPFGYGDAVTFTMTVFNQGGIATDNIEITEHIPCGYIYEASNNGTWTYDPATGIATTTITDLLEAGASTTVDIVLTVQPCADANAWTNLAEISDFTDEDGNPVDDIDSTPDTDPTNDGGGVPGGDTDDEVDGDGTGTPGDDTVDGDEDDADPEMIEIFDLALIKTIDNVGPYGEGDIATFDITVFNQGNVDAYSIEVTDYLNEGYSFDPAINAGWAQIGDLVVLTIDGPLAPGASAALTLSLTVEIPATANVNSWYNEAEISSADNDTDPTNAGPTDSDSTPDNDPDNDNDLVDGPDDDLIFDEEDDNDNEINEDPSDPFGLGDDDEDDNDAAGISVVGGLGDTVWKDLDGDGVQDPDEPGVPGVIVTLTDCEGNVVDVQMTNADGFYFFNNLIPGDYQVQFDISGLPVGCAFTQQNIGNDELDSDVDATGLAPCTTIQGGEYDSTFDAGLLVLVNIGDFVWHDLDGDGVQDPGEPGIPGVDVFLYDADNNLVSITTTDENGEYLFENIYPGTYYIAFDDPDGFDVTLPNTTADDNDSDVTNFILSPSGSTTDLFTIEYGQEDDLTFDAGYYKCIPVGQYVWYDYIENNIRDVNENGLNGVPVIIYQLQDGVWVEWDETTTGGNPDPSQPSDDGYWKFCVPPGTYYVEVDYPDVLGNVTVVANANGYQSITTPGESTVDSDLTEENGKNTTEAFTVFSAQMFCNIGAGFYPEAAVGNRVWEDTNLDGMQDADEPSVQDVVVQAYAVTSGLMVDEAVTDAEGKYRLSNLKKEDYYIKFIPPAGYDFTVANGGDDEMDSDVDGTYGANTTRAYSMTPGEEVMNVDAGLAFGILPVEWLSIDVQRRGQTNVLDWATAAEINNDHFRVERLVDGSGDFVAIGTVEPQKQAGTKRYSFVDEDSEGQGLYYYRVVQVDLDGTEDVSDIVDIVVERGANVIRLAPNPATQFTTLEVTMNSSEAVQVDILGADGRLVRSYTIDGNGAEFVDGSIVIDELPAGIYSIRVQQADFTEVKRLIMVR